MLQVTSTPRVPKAASRTEGSLEPSSLSPLACGGDSEVTSPAGHQGFPPPSPALEICPPPQVLTASPGALGPPAAQLPEPLAAEDGATVGSPPPNGSPEVLDRRVHSSKKKSARKLRASGSRASRIKQKLFAPPEVAASEPHPGARPTPDIEPQLDIPAVRIEAGDEPTLGLEAGNASVASSSGVPNLTELLGEEAGASPRTQGPLSAPPGAVPTLPPSAALSERDPFARPSSPPLPLMMGLTTQFTFDLMEVTRLQRRVPRLVEVRCDPAHAVEPESRPNVLRWALRGDTQVYGQETLVLLSETGIEEARFDLSGLATVWEQKPTGVRPLASKLSAARCAQVAVQGPSQKPILAVFVFAPPPFFFLPVLSQDTASAMLQIVDPLGANRFIKLTYDPDVSLVTRKQGSSPGIGPGYPSLPPPPPPPLPLAAF